MSQPETANSEWEISLKSSLLFKKKNHGKFDFSLHGLLLYFSIKLMFKSIYFSAYIISSHFHPQLLALEYLLSL